MFTKTVTEHSLAVRENCSQFFSVRVYKLFKYIISFALRCLLKGPSDFKWPIKSCMYLNERWSTGPHRKFWASIIPQRTVLQSLMKHRLLRYFIWDFTVCQSTCWNERANRHSGFYKNHYHSQNGSGHFIRFFLCVFFVGGGFSVAVLQIQKTWW